MRTTLGLLLMFLGSAVMLYGIGSALIDLVALYQGALADPLNQAETAEQDASRGMIRSAVIGAYGLVPFVAGSVLLKVSLLQRAYRARRRPTRP